MGNTACCTVDNDTTNIGEVNATASFRPQKKAMAGLIEDLQGGGSVNGVGLKEAVALQAVLRGYLARRMLMQRLKFEPERGDIKDLHYGEVPEHLVQHCASLEQIIGEVPKPEHSRSLEIGPVLFNDGSIYVGEWSQSSARSGFGIQYWPETKRIYKGEWENDQPSGEGLLLYENEDMYKGHFKDGLPDGEGLLMTHDRTRYQGEWKEGKRHGRGKELLHNSCTYEGGYANDLMEGFGLFCWDGVHNYSGHWKAGQKHGHGQMTWNDGKIYVGAWEYDKQHGEGILTEVSGEPKKGEWNKGRRTRWVD